MATKSDLLESAKALAAPGTEAAAEFAGKREALAAEVNRVFLGRADLERLVGADNEAMAADNGRNFARFMESVFAAYRPEVLVDTALWAFRAYRSHGFRVAYWPAHLDTWVEVLRSQLSKQSFEEVYPFYNWLIVSIPLFTELTESAVERADGQDSQGHPISHP